MNRKHLMTSVLLNVCTFILFIEHLCGLELAFSFLIVCAIINLIAHIIILGQHAIQIMVEYEEPVKKNRKNMR